MTGKTTIRSSLKPMEITTNSMAAYMLANLAGKEVEGKDMGELLATGNMLEAEVPSGSGVK
jgi:hypothetical protein